MTISDVDKSPFSPLPSPPTNHKFPTKLTPHPPQALHLPLKFPLPRCPHILLHHNLPRLQRPPLPPPHRAPPRSHCNHYNSMVRISIWIQHGKAFRARVMGWRKVEETCWELVARNRGLRWCKREEKKISREDEGGKVKEEDL